MIHMFLNTTKSIRQILKLQEVIEGLYLVCNTSLLGHSSAFPCPVEANL